MHRWSWMPECGWRVCVCGGGVYLKKLPCQSLCSTHWEWDHHSFGDPLSKSRSWRCWRTLCWEEVSDQPGGKCFSFYLSVHLSMRHLPPSLSQIAWTTFNFFYLPDFGTEPNGVGEITKLFSTTGVKALPSLWAWYYIWLIQKLPSY